MVGLQARRRALTGVPMLVIGALLACVVGCAAQAQAQEPAQPEAIGSALNVQASTVLPVLGLVLALDSGDPYASASSAVSLAAAANVIPVYGQIIAVVIAVVGALVEEDIPMSAGHAGVAWDAQGRIHAYADQDAEGGGATALRTMEQLLDGIEDKLAEAKDENGSSRYGLIPARMPTVGYLNDPDGLNYATPGHLYLQWTDEQGQLQQRYYDGTGERADGSGETLAGDGFDAANDELVREAA